MANELTLSGLSIQFTKSGASVGVTPDGIQIDVAGLPYAKGTQAVQLTDTVFEPFDSGAVVHGGYVYLKNLDGVNFLEIDFGDADYPLRLEAGEWCIFRTNTLDFLLKANTAIVFIEFLVFSN